MKKSSSVFVAGGTGMVGSAIIRALKSKGYNRIIANYHRRQPKSEAVEWHPLELTDQKAVADFFRSRAPDYVFLAAARVGGIGANNQYRADFLYDNLQIQNNVVHSSFHAGVKKLLFLGSSCIYPRDCPQPIKEEYLLTGPLEYTNEPYATAKIAGMKLCESFNLQRGSNFVSVMPTNLYGPEDNFDLEASHVLPALIRKFHLAKLAGQGDFKAIDQDEKILGPIPETMRKDLDLESASPRPLVRLWGTGKPRREFLHVDDLAEACLFIMEKADFEDLAELRRKETETNVKELHNLRNCHVNIGCGTDESIKKVAERVQSIVGFQGRVVWDDSMPDGTPRKLLEVSRMESFGWHPRIDLHEGIQSVYTWYLNHSG